MDLFGLFGVLPAKLDCLVVLIGIACFARFALWLSMNGCFQTFCGGVVCRI